MVIEQAWRQAQAEGGQAGTAYLKHGQTGSYCGESKGRIHAVKTKSAAQLRWSQKTSVVGENHCQLISKSQLKVNTIFRFLPRGPKLQPNLGNKIS